MGFELRKQSAQEVKTPPPSRVTFFVDMSGNPVMKDSTGAVTPAVSIGGSPVPFLQQSSDPTPVPNTIFVYVKDGELVQRKPSGSISPLGGGPTIRWKNGTPGNPFVTGDTVNADFGDIIMISVEDPDTININLPDITSDSGGKTVSVRNFVDKKSADPGLIHVTPGASDAVEAFATGATVVTGGVEVIYFTLESDGVGRWSHVIFGGGQLVWTEL